MELVQSRDDCTYRILGQDVKFGKAFYVDALYGWPSNNGDARAIEYTNKPTEGNPQVRYFFQSFNTYRAFITKGTPFDVLQYFIDYYGGVENIPSGNVCHNYNFTGLVEITGWPKNGSYLKLIKYTANGVGSERGTYFIGTCDDAVNASNEQALESLAQKIAVNLNYMNGIDLNNITLRDHQVASMYFWQPMPFDDTAVFTSPPNYDISNPTLRSTANVFIGVPNGYFSADYWVNRYTATREEWAAACDLGNLITWEYDRCEIINTGVEGYGPWSDVGYDIEGSTFVWPGTGMYCIATYSSVGWWLNSEVYLYGEFVPPEPEHDIPPREDPEDSDNDLPTPHGEEPMPPEDTDPTGVGPVEIHIHVGGDNPPSGDPKPNPDGGGNNNVSRNEYDPTDDKHQPPVPVSNTGIAHLYCPTGGQLAIFNQALWDQDLIDYIKGLFTNEPMDAIISLALYPMDFETVTDSEGRPIKGATKQCVIGNRAMTYSGDPVEMDTLNRDIATVDFGTIDMIPKWNSFLDYSPYTQIQLYLPYIGFVDIDPSEVYVTDFRRSTSVPNGKLSVFYNINLYTGDCVAYVYATGASATSVLIGSWSGNCSMQIPLSGRNYSAYFGGIIGGAVSSGIQLASGNVGSAIGTAVQAAVNTFTPQVTRSGSFSQGATFISPAKAFIIRKVPHQSASYKTIYNSYKGRTTHWAFKLARYAGKGFQVVSDIKMTGFTGTDAEATELKALLAEGVYM